MIDLISREEVLRSIITAGEVEPDLGYTHLYKVIENLPSAEPKTAVWVGEGDGYVDGEIILDTWYCSNCDYCPVDDEKPNWNYCPNCGAKMEVTK